MEKKFVVLFLALIFVSGCIQTEEQTTTVQTTVPTTIQTTIPTTVETTLETTVETAITTTIEKTTTTIKKSDKECNDYCVMIGYKSGLCVINSMECRAKHPGEHEPRGDKYCFGPIDTCCCLS